MSILRDLLGIVPHGAQALQGATGHPLQGGSAKLLQHTARSGGLQQPARGLGDGTGNIQVPQGQPMHQMQYAQYMNADGSGGGFGPQAPAPRFSAPQANTLGQSNGSQELPSIHQGGAFNPGFNPVQGGGLNYQQAPQPATFNSLQQANYNPHRPGIFF